MEAANSSGDISISIGGFVNFANLPAEELGNFLEGIAILMAVLSQEPH